MRTIFEERIKEFRRWGALHEAILHSYVKYGTILGSGVSILSAILQSIAFKPTDPSNAFWAYTYISLFWRNRQTIRELHYYWRIIERCSPAAG